MTLRWIWDGTGLAASSSWGTDDTPFEYGIIQRNGRFHIYGDAEVIGKNKKGFSTLRGALEYCQRNEDELNEHRDN